MMNWCGVFPKDMWCYLFKFFFDYESVLMCGYAAKRLRDFMTKEQKFMLDAVSNSNNTYRAACIKIMQTHTSNYNLQMKSMEKSQMGTCSCCLQRVKWKKLSKHQRMCSRRMKFEMKRDQCNDCGWMLPYLFYHILGQPCPIKPIITQCPYCKITVHNRFNPWLRMHHTCPMTPYPCQYGHELVPTCIIEQQAHQCASMCNAFISGGKIRCRGKCRDDTGFCHRHQQPNCTAKTKLGPNCTRAVKTGEVMCSQHLAITKKLLNK